MTTDTHPHPSKVPVWLIIWAVLTAAGLWLRPLMPVDETRYLAVAWEMWQSGNFLVPHLNGETYSHKPPLLFWLMHLGWAAFGVSETWARLVAPLFGLASLALTAMIARSLWPTRPAIARTAPIVLIGMTYFGFFGTLTMFDMLVTACALLGLLGMLRAGTATTGRGLVAGFALLGLAIGLGVLAKGPAILLHTLPVALLAPWWIARSETRQAPPGGWLTWHGGILAAVLSGAAIALAWALPAADAGGEAYRNAIFWGQSAGRITESFAHARAWWWYLALIPALLAPWSAWPSLWRAGVQSAGGFLQDPAHRFLIAWIVPAFIVFSAISGKQAHYLLPELAAAAILIATLVKRAAETASPGRFDLMVPGGLTLALGVILTLAPLTPWAEKIPPGVAPHWFALMAAAGGAVAYLGLRNRSLCTGVRMGLLTGLSATTIVALHLAAHGELVRAFDTTATARHLAQLEERGVPIAHFGKYHAQYQFTGRLKNSLSLIDRTPEASLAWAKRTPDGRIVAYRDETPTDIPADRVWPFRGKYTVVLTAAEVAADPARVLPSHAP